MFNMQALIDELIRKNNQVKSGKRDNAKFSVSDAGGCYRARIYKRLGIEPTREIEIEGLRKMLAGDSSHEKLQYLLKRHNKLFLSENEVETEHIKGHPDAVIKNGEKVLLEIKTTEKFQLKYIQKLGAKREHKLQMFTYWLLLREDIKDLDHAVLSYVKREDFEATDYYFNWSEEIKEKVDAEWKPLIKHWLEKTLPECTCKTLFNGAGTKYCRYGIDDLNCCDESLFREEVEHESKHN